MVTLYIILGSNNNYMQVKPIGHSAKEVNVCSSTELITNDFISTPEPQHSLLSYSDEVQHKSQESKQNLPWQLWFNLYGMVSHKGWTQQILL